MRKILIINLILIILFSFNWELNVSTGKISNLEWMPSSSLVENDCGHAHVYNNKIYFVGQYYVQLYDPEKENWTVINEAGTGYRSYRGDSAIIGDKIYIIHGWTGDDTKVYDISDNSMSTFTPPPTNRIDVAISALNGILYVSGGWLSGDSTSITTVEAYNPSNDTWWTVSPMNTSRKNHEMVGSENYLYAIGGYTGLGFITFTKRIERYDPLTDEWEIMESTNYEFYQCGSTIIGDDQIIVSNVIHSSIYDISSNSWDSWETFEYNNIIPHDSDYKGGYFANSIVYLDNTAFSVGLRDAPGNYYNYVWTLDPSQLLNGGKTTETYITPVLLFDITVALIILKRIRKYPQ